MYDLGYMHPAINEEVRRRTCDHHSLHQPPFSSWRDGYCAAHCRITLVVCTYSSLVPLCHLSSYSVVVPAQQVNQKLKVKAETTWYSVSLWGNLITEAVRYGTRCQGWGPGITQFYLSPTRLSTSGMNLQAYLPLKHEAGASTYGDGCRWMRDACLPSTIIHGSAQPRRIAKLRNIDA